ncbi:MAG: PAS domain-containing protein [Chloroflexi bacterium]|nr:MAG: PAS domain-containing protein [Chloroflexota bacterium]
MSFEYTPLLIPLVMATAVSIILIIYALPRRQAAGAKPFLLLMLGVAIWLIGYTFEISGRDINTSLFWANISYFGITSLPVAWLIFSLEYSGRSRLLTVRNISLLFFEPAIIMLLIWTDNFHHLFRQSVTMTMTDLMPLLEIVRGPSFWVHTAYSYLLLVLGTVILGIGFFRSSRIYRRQMGIVFVGALIPWVANIFFVFFAKSGPTLDPTPFSFLGTGILMSWAIFGYSFIDIAPIARNNVVENLNDAMFVLDSKNRVIDINPAARRLLGDIDGWIVGQPAAELFKAWPHLIEKFRDEIQIHKEVMFHDGEQERFYDLRISPLLNKQGGVNGRLVMLHDTTEHKQVADELRLAKEAAETANRAKSTFLANMSHELRTPLTVIIGYAELLQELTSDNQYELLPDRLEKIKWSADHLLTIISELLDLSKIEAGRMELYETICNVPELIESVTDSVIPLLTQNGNVVDMIIAPEVDSLLTDEVKLRQILLNLLSNAAKFTENGRIELSVFSQTNAKSGENGSAVPQLVFQVSDTGIGLSDDQIETLFEPFVQAELSTTKSYGGTGLGLSISRHLCHILGGTIQVESMPGQGSIFTVYLPWQRHEVPNKQEQLARV